MIDDVPADAEILREEIFGPVAADGRLRYRGRGDRAANDTEYGLVAYVYTGDLAARAACREKLESGMVGLNRGLVSDPAAPFGGVKQSGLGREGGHDGIMEFMETQVHRRHVVIDAPIKATCLAKGTTETGHRS